MLGELSPDPSFIRLIVLHSSQEGLFMSDHFWLSDEQLKRIEPHSMVFLASMSNG